MHRAPGSSGCSSLAPHVSPTWTPRAAVWLLFTSALCLLPAFASAELPAGWVSFDGVTMSPASPHLEFVSSSAHWSSGGVDWAEGRGAEGDNFDRTRHAACAVAPSDSSRMVFDVTGVVAGWASGETVNNGIIIAAAPGEEAAVVASRGAGLAGLKSRLVIWFSPVRDD
jgi:hypothetical protein